MEKESSQVNRLKVQFFFSLPWKCKQIVKISDKADLGQWVGCHMDTQLVVQGQSYGQNILAFLVLWASRRSAVSSRADAPLTPCQSPAQESHKIFMNKILFLMLRLCRGFCFGRPVHKLVPNGYFLLLPLRINSAGWHFHCTKTCWTPCESHSLPRRSYFSQINK